MNYWSSYSQLMVDYSLNLVLIEIDVDWAYIDL